MKKRLLALALLALGFSANTYAQSTPLYMGYYYDDLITVMHTATYTEIGTITMTSDAGSVDGCYGLSLEPSSGDMYILYQLDAGDATSRRLGIIDVSTGEITDIGVIGNMNDIGFVNGQLYATTGSYSGQQFVEVDKTDASTTSLLSPSSDNESC